MRLDSYINRLDEVLSDILVSHRQTDGRHNYIYNVYVNISVNIVKTENEYHACRFRPANRLKIS